MPCKFCNIFRWDIFTDFHSDRLKTHYYIYSIYSICYTLISNQHVSTQYREGLERVIIWPLLRWYSDYTSISAILISQKNILSAIKTVHRQHLKGGQQKTPQKFWLYQSIKYVKFFSTIGDPDTVVSKEVVSIRAIWGRISFVGPVPAKHRRLFCSPPEIRFPKRNSKVKHSNFEIQHNSTPISFPE